MESIVETKEIHNDYLQPVRESKTKMIYDIILFSLILLLLVFALLYTLLFYQYFSSNNYFGYYPGNKFLQSVVFLLFLIITFCTIPSLFLLEFFPFILVTLISYKRTGYIAFAIESIIELQFFLFLDVIIIVQQFVSYSIYILIILIPALITLEYQILKKPLISGWNFTELSRTLVIDKSDVVHKQSINVTEYEDGYSQRPIFDNLQDSLSGIIDKNEINFILYNFAKFLLINGDLIALDTDDQTIKLYLRTTFIDRRDMLRIPSQIKKLKYVIKKDGLTCITINLDSLEMAFKLNPLDYKKLGEITYFKLGEHILQQFKLAIREFKEGDYVKSYERVNPQIQKFGRKPKARKIKIVTH